MEPPPPPPTEDETTTMDVEVTQPTTATGKNEGIVYVAVDGFMSQILKIKVKRGDSIPTIQKKIKLKGENTFASCAAFQIQIHQSKEQTETESIDMTTETEIPLIAMADPMCVPVEWISDVSWGTAEQPLIVYTPTPINTSKCIVFIRVLCICIFHTFELSCAHPSKCYYQYALKQKPFSNLPSQH